MSEEKKFLDGPGLKHYHDTYVNPKITNIITGVTPPENAGTAAYTTKAGTATYATNAGTAAYANKATTATQAGKVGTATVGSTNKPVYISSGVPQPCSFELNATVPANAKFTDNNTTYAKATTSADGLMSKEDKAKLNNTNIKYVTQAEYNAIGTSVNSDNILYIITDVESNAGNIPYDNSDSGIQVTNVQDAIDHVAEAFQDGCDTIVAGCTTYGETPASNSPSSIVNAIGAIYTERYNEGVSATKVGTATAAQVLTGKTFTNASSVGISGTMTNNGAVSKTFTPSSTTQTYTIPAGYHNGSGKVTCNAWTPSSSKDAKMIVRTTNTNVLGVGDGTNAGSWTWTNPYGAGYIYVRYTDKPRKTYSDYASNCYINGTKQSSSGGSTHNKTYVHDVAIDAGGQFKFSWQKNGGIGACIAFYYKR